MQLISRGITAGRLESRGSSSGQEPLQGLLAVRLCPLIDNQNDYLDAIPFAARKPGQTKLTVGFDNGLNLERVHS
jgi:hypothetical protein